MISVVELDHWQWAYRTVFYAGPTVETMTKVGQSREKMKGVRLIEYEDGRIGVFTRPVREVMGYTEIDSLSELTPHLTANAPEIGPRSEHGSWGPNALYPLGGDRVGVLGHIVIDDTRYHYMAAVWEFDRRSRAFSLPRIIADRKQFPPGVYRRPFLNVFYACFLDLERGLLYGGLGDVQMGVIPVPYPFR